MVFLEDEEGAQRVETLLRNEEVFLPFLALLETYYITLQEQPEDVADKRYALLKQLPATILWSLDEPSLLTAGRLKATYHVSLADALIATMAIRNKAVLVHKDPEIAALSGIVQMETLPFKKQI
ncbi:MAG: VapC toxin family PIN domain ribonuclease [Anaerolineae bacterium]|nr:MAG: VapC toxin family PIN domain ribonuclease [Anaerolineae bacterium]